MDSESFIAVIAFLQLIASVAVGGFLWRVARRLNQINQNALDIQNFVEIFVVPQQILAQNDEGVQKFYGWNLLIKNASSYPIYLNRFTLNGLSHLVGNSVIPTGSDNWYAIPVPQDVQNKNTLSLEVLFEDYLGKKYSTRHYGIFENLSWQIRSEKRVQI